MLVHAQPWHSKALPACVLCTENLSAHQFSLFQTNPSAPKPYCCCSGSIWMWASLRLWTWWRIWDTRVQKMAESACSTDGTSLRASPTSHVGHSLRKLTVRTPSKHALLLINIKGYFLISVQVCSVCCCVSLAFSLLLSVVFSFTLFPLLFKCLPFNLCSKLGFGNSSKGGGAGDIIVPSEPRGDKVRERQQTISLSFTEQ